MANMTLVKFNQELPLKVIELAIKMSDLSDKAKAVARLAYDMGSDFVPQFEAKLRMAQDKVESLERTLSEMSNMK